MEAGRLGLVHKQEVKHRKFVCVMNDLAKTQQDLMEGYIRRDKHEAAFRFDKSASILRKINFRQRVLQKCLKSRREIPEQSKPPTKYGTYGGIPLEYMSKDIDAYIDKMHPRIRRMKKVQQLMQNSLDRGAILSPNKIIEKIDDFFTGNYRGEDNLYRDVDELEQERDKRRRERSERKDHERLVLPPIPNFKNKKISKSNTIPEKRSMTVEPLMRVDILNVEQSNHPIVKKSARLLKLDVRNEKSPGIKSPGGYTERKPSKSSNKSAQIIPKNDALQNTAGVTQEIADIKHPRSKNLESVAEDEEEDENKSRGSLILPPLRMTKALVKR